MASAMPSGARNWSSTRHSAQKPRWAALEERKRFGLPRVQVSFASRTETSGM